MKDCGIVKDLLPLVAEHMASEESTAFVKEHLETCADCKAAFDAMKAPVETEPAAPLKTVKRAVKKRGCLIAGLIACLVAALLVSAFARLTKPIPVHTITYLGGIVVDDPNVDGEHPYWDEAGIVYMQNHGHPYTMYLYPIHGVQLNAERSGNVLYIGAYTTIGYQWLLERESTYDVSYEFDLSDTDAVYFEPFDNTDHILLYIKAGYTPEAGFALPRLVMNYYLLIALAGTVLLAAVWFILRLTKREKASRVFGVLLLIAGSGTLAFLAAGFPATTIAPARELAFVCVIALLLIGAGLCGRKLLKKE